MARGSSALSVCLQLSHSHWYVMWGQDYDMLVGRQAGADWGGGYPQMVSLLQPASATSSPHQWNCCLTYGQSGHDQGPPTRARPDTWPVFTCSSTYPAPPSSRLLSPTLYLLLQLAIQVLPVSQLDPRCRMSSITIESNVISKIWLTFQILILESYF